MYNYNAYNLGISSALPLPELRASAEAAADITIRFGHVNWSPPPDAIGSDELCFEVNTDTAYFFWDQLGKFLVTGGNTIVIDPHAGVEERLLRLPLLGVVLAVLLHQRGYLVLHASAVAVDDEAVIFIGNKGLGKSTTAATLYGRGHQIIADDVVALSVEAPGPPMVLPGFPQIKLYPEAVAASLGDDHNLLPELADGYEKRGRRVTDRFAQRSLPLRSIYVLGRGPAIAISQLGSQAALLKVIANSYMTRFGNQLLHDEEASAHLRQCSSVVRKVSVYRLERCNDLAQLPSIAQLVEEQPGPVFV